MNNFKDFNIKPKLDFYLGERISIHKILNKDISVIKYKIQESKFKNKGSGKCLYLQIKFEGDLRLVFIDSVILMDLIIQVEADRFPFNTRIVRDNGCFEFT